MRAVLLVFVFALSAPLAHAGGEEATTSTGDVDVYQTVVPPETLCPAVIYVTQVSLTLLDPSPGDVVALSLQGETTLSGPVALATFEQPHASITVQVNGCKDFVIEVVGVLVDGETPYQLDY